MDRVPKVELFAGIQGVNGRPVRKIVSVSG
jgi:hypothetical protein